MKLSDIQHASAMGHLDAMQGHLTSIARMVEYSPYTTDGAWVKFDREVLRAVEESISNLRRDLSDDQKPRTT